MFRNCQRAQCPRNIRRDKGGAGGLGSDHIVGEANPAPVHSVTLKVSGSNPGFS